MAEAFLNLSREDQLEALNVAAARSGRAAHVLEKDIWVVWTLSALFEGPSADHLVFKGGTSLSKAYGVIDRFSEDIDVTYDVTELVGDLVDNAVSKGEEKLPPTKSQSRRWRDVVEEALPRFVQDTIADQLRARAKADTLDVHIVAKGDQVFVSHEPTAEAANYMSPDVLVEFGGRSTGLPVEEKLIVCDAAEHLPDLVFPTATVRVMHIERTFWEKATAVHTFCKREKLPGERLARHWYDLTKLAEAGYATLAIANRQLADQVAEHKTIFFFIPGIDYHDAIGGRLQLVPTGAFANELAADYNAMREGGLLNDAAPPFEEILRQCRDLETLANASDDTLAG